MVRPARKAALESALGRRLRLELVWRQAYAQEIAAEAADDRLAAHVAADPSLRRALTGRTALRRAPRLNLPALRH